MGIFEKLEPAPVWKHFEAILKIPHTSKNEEKIAEYIKDFAKFLKLSVARDEVGNILVTQEETQGCENVRGVVLQGHMDMVGVAKEGFKHDFLKDPIKAKIEGDFVRAYGTTLGADNGIGIAIMLAMMEDKALVHPKLEYLFTVNEESGMDGAHGLSPEFVKGRQLINLDTEEFGQIYISCAGGADSVINLEVQREDAASDAKTVVLKIRGLKGGHSGVDINLGRGSGNKIAARLLAAGFEVAPIRIRSIKGGNKRNSISDHAEIILDLPLSKMDLFKSSVYREADVIKEELTKTDPNITVKIEDALPNNLKPMTIESTKRLIDLLIALPHGVLAMSPDIPELVETSTNIGTIKTENSKVEVVLLTRSAVNSSISMVKQTIRTIASLVGAKVDEPRGYPGWKPNRDSYLLKVAREVFKEMYNEEPLIKAVHAGLECGIFAEKLSGIDMISIGPTMANVHSPSEELYIPSVKKFYEYLSAIMRTLSKR